MKKRMVALLLALIIMVSATAPFASASTVTTLGLSKGLNLDYLGTTASCSFTVIMANSDIKVIHNSLAGE